MKPKHVLQTVVNDDVKGHLTRLAEIKGVSISEFIRSLILQDLEKRTVFTNALKNSLENIEEIKEVVVDV